MCTAWSNTTAWESVESSASEILCTASMINTTQTEMFAVWLKNCMRICLENANEICMAWKYIEWESESVESSASKILSSIRNC